ncbi:MAG: rhodanese-like domain-containing protein [Verrucomicrobia bacterium]|nr:rhodanese-like domain-containing protein [Verrucomicrobiota bacterium]
MIPHVSRTSPARRAARTVLCESVAVALLGGFLALAANQVSPRGLELTHNYFPGAIRPLGHAGGGAGNAVTPGATQAVAAAGSAMGERIRAHGMRVVSSNEVRQCFDGPRYALGHVVFIDARDTREYEAGHIPGAYQLDHYRAHEYLPHVLPPCLAARHVVVYCVGGDCEDSEFAALLLRDAGVPPERILVYSGGFSEWEAAGWPVETGARDSGALRRTLP